MKNQITKIALCTIILLGSLTALAAPTNVSSRNTDVKNEDSDNTWLVPLSITRSPSSSATHQINEVAYVVENNGKYQVELQLGSYSILNDLQIVDPEKKTDAISEFGDLDDIPMDATSSAFQELKTEDSDLFNTYISYDVCAENVADYYLDRSEYSVLPGDDLLDTGIITVTLDNLDDSLCIKTYYDPWDLATSRKRRVAKGTVEIQFLEAQKIEFEKIANSDTNILAAKWMGQPANQKYRYGMFQRNNYEDSFFNQVFDKIVDIQVRDGVTYATLTLTEDAVGEDPAKHITKVEYATKRTVGREVDTGSAYQLVESVADYEEAQIIDGKVTIPISSLKYGQGVRLFTTETDSVNEGVTDIYKQYCYVAWLHLWSVEDSDLLDLSTTNPETGVTLYYSSYDFPEEKYRFDITTDLTRLPALERDSQYAFAGESNYIPIEVVVTNLEDNTISDITSSRYGTRMEIPIPEDWSDRDRIALMIGYSGGTGTNNISSMGTMSEDGKYFILNNSEQYFNRDLIVQYIKYSEEIPEADGLYTVDISTLHETNLLQKSMSSAAFYREKGYIEVENGQATLYASLGEVTISGQAAYMSKIFSIDYDSNETELEIMKYRVLNDALEMHLENPVPEILKLPLTYPSSNESHINEYLIKVIVPVMDGLQGESLGVVLLQGMHICGY